MILTSLTILADAMTPAFIFLYIGPEIILPVASFVASIVGILLMFWRYVTKTVRKLFRRVFLRKKDTEATEAALAVVAEPAAGEPMEQVTPLENLNS